jgi:hypothetical protein
MVKKSKTINFLHTIVLIITPLILFDCNSSSDCECASFKEIPQSTKDWFYFKDSSYWVFRMLEDTTQIDTIVQVGYKDESSNDKCNNDHNATIQCSERKRFFYNHSNLELYPSYDPGTYKNGYHMLTVSSPGIKNEIFNLESGTPNLNLHGWLFQFPLTLNKKAGYYIISDSLSDFKTDKVIFNSTTLKIKYTLSESINDIFTEVWWTKGVGIVKYIKSEGKTPKATWELVDYQLK